MLKTNNTKQRLISTAVMLSIVSLFGFVLWLIFQWPSQFVLGEVADSRVTLSDIVAGTPLSIPLAPWAALIVVTFLATSQRWWGTIAVVVLCLLGVLFVISGWARRLDRLCQESVPRNRKEHVWMCLATARWELGSH